jgi:hypothetical protein
MEEITNRKIRKVDNSFAYKFLEISKQKKTYCLLNKYKYAYLGSDEIIENSEETLIYQFANELHIEYELLDLETKTLVFQIIVISANQFNRINNQVFGSIYHVFKPSSGRQLSERIKFDDQWSEMIKLMDHEDNIRNVYKSLISEKTLLDNAEIIIKREVLNLKKLESNRLKELLNLLYDSNDYKAQNLCEVIIDTFILSFEEQNLMAASYEKKIINHKNPEFSEIRCAYYQLSTTKMQKHVQDIQNGFKFFHHKNPSSPYCFRICFFSFHDPIN